MTPKKASRAPSGISADGYRGYAGLAPLAGLLSMKDATTTGLTVTQSVERLKRLHWALRRLHLALVAHIPAMPIYELKMAFSLHAFYCSEHVGEFAKRVREMRQPPYGLEVAPDASLDIFLDEVLAAPSTEALLLGLYEKAFPAVIRALEHLMADTNRMFDHPSYRICRFTLLEMEEAEAYGVDAIRCLVKDEDRAALGAWLGALDRMLAAAGDLTGARPLAAKSWSGISPPPPTSMTPFPAATSASSTPTTWASTPRPCSSTPTPSRCPRPSCSTSSACARSMCRR